MMTSLLFLLCRQGPADDVIAQVRTRWLNRKVWVYGAAAYSNEFTETWNPMLAATVVGVDDNPKKQTAVAPPAWPEDWAWDAIPKHTQYRLLLRLPRMPFHRHINAVGDSPEYHPPFFAQTFFSTSSYQTKDGKWHSSTPPKHPAQTQGWLFFGAPDDLKYWMTEVDAKAILRGESRHVRRAFSQHRVVTGMNKEEVARIVGFPTVLKPLEQIWAADVWSYPGITPFTRDYTFNRKGRLKDIYGGPGLP